MDIFLKKRKRNITKKTNKKEYDNRIEMENKSDDYFYKFYRLDMGIYKKKVWMSLKLCYTKLDS